MKRSKYEYMKNKLQIGYTCFEYKQTLILQSMWHHKGAEVPLHDA